MKCLLLLSSSLLLLVFLACSKNNNKKDVIKIEGFLITDALGNQIGEIGESDDDWQIRNWSELTVTEQSFLNFSDNVDLANTTVTTLYNPAAYPNPCSSSSTLRFQTDDSVKVRIAVVDASGQVFITYATKMKGARNYAFDFSDSTRYPSGKSLRYYYSFSASGNLNFKAGYGDLKICRRSPIFSCF